MALEQQFAHALRQAVAAAAALSQALLQIFAAGLAITVAALVKRHVHQPSTTLAQEEWR